MPKLISMPDLDLETIPCKNSKSRLTVRMRVYCSVQVVRQMGFASGVWVDEEDGGLCESFWIHLDMRIVKKHLQCACSVCCFVAKVHFL